MTKDLPTTASSLCGCRWQAALFTVGACASLKLSSFAFQLFLPLFCSFRTVTSSLVCSVVWVINPPPPPCRTLNSLGSVFLLFLALFCVTVGPAYTTFIHTTYQWFRVCLLIILSGDVQYAECLNFWITFWWAVRKVRVCRCESTSLVSASTNKRTAVNLTWASMHSRSQYSYCCPAASAHYWSKLTRLLINIQSLEIICFWMQHKT